MSEVVLGIGASHTTLMNTQWQRVDHLERAHCFRDALGTARQALETSRPDLVVIVGSNHFRGFWLDLMPAFTIGVGEVIGSGEHGTPKGLLRSDAGAGLEICNALTAVGFDMSFSIRLSVDHGISHAVQWLLPSAPPPIVPLVVNCFAPPLPSLGRCLQLGDALRGILPGITGSKRVAVIGTGGLSHRLPFPDWRSPATEDDEFFVESWRNGRGGWEEYEERRRGLILNAPPELDEEFDRSFLADLAEGRIASFDKQWSQDELVARAGNGGNEIRAWLTMAAALGHVPARNLAYAAMPEWLTGMAVSLLEPTA